MFRKNYQILVVSGISLLGLASLKNEDCSKLYAKENQPIKNNTDTCQLKECDRLIRRYKEEQGIPGLVVAVSKDGRTVYSKGFGYSDVENSVRAHSRTVMRIASISKPITCTIAGMLYEDDRLDFDKSIHCYLDDLPAFKWENNDVKITCRQLMSHTSGIRHYEKETDEKDKKCEKTDDSEFPEFLSNKTFKTTKEALEIFINDKLRFEPGKDYLYTTYGYTLLSAVLEKSNGSKPFSDSLKELFKLLDMNETYLDTNSPLISNRSKYYERNKNGRLINVPEVNSSYKFAGGGILSTTGDLLKFGNHMLTAYQSHVVDEISGNNFLVLKPSTIKNFIWSSQSNIPSKNQNFESLDILKVKMTYGMGWVLGNDKTTNKLKYAYHTGGAVGASSCLLVVPSDEKNENSSENKTNGVIVAVLCNSQNVTEIVKFTHNVSRFFY